MGRKKRGSLLAILTTGTILSALLIGLSSCQQQLAKADKAALALQSAGADQQIPAAEAAWKAIRNLEQAETIPFVVKITNEQADSVSPEQTNTTLFFSGMINKQQLQLKGRFHDEEIVVYQGPSRVELITDNDSKIIQKQQFGMVSPLDHLALAKNYYRQSVYATSPIFVDNVRYEHIVIKIPQEDIKNQLQQFLGTQFSDTISLDNSVQNIAVEYHLAVHPVSYSLKQCEVRVSSGAGERLVEDHIFFRFLNG